jgi:hypothetical protein
MASLFDYLKLFTGHLGRQPFGSVRGGELFSTSTQEAQPVPPPRPKAPPVVAPTLVNRRFSGSVEEMSPGGRTLPAGQQYVIGIDDSGQPVFSRMPNFFRGGAPLDNATVLEQLRAGQITNDPGAVRRSAEQNMMSREIAPGHRASSQQFITGMGQGGAFTYGNNPRYFREGVPLTNDAIQRWLNIGALPR